MNIKELEESNQIILKCVSGSHLYGLNTPSSDVDIRGIFLNEPQDILDVSGEKNQEISDDKQDTKYYSLRKFLKLAMDCNPNIIELLFVPNECILQKSPLYDELISHRDWFMSKKARHTFMGYAYAQIKKAKGIGKKGNDISKRVNEDGIKLLRQLLFKYKIDEDVQNGLVATSPYNLHPEYQNDILNIQRTFGSDFLNYLRKQPEITPFEGSFKDLILKDEIKSMMPPKVNDHIQWLKDDKNGMPFRPCIFESDPNNYDASSVEGSTNLYRLYHHGTGFFNKDDLQIVCHSISIEREKNDFAGVIRVDLDQYRKDKREYDSFWEWMANRNESRYSKDWDNEMMVDNKNLMHTMRLLLCAKSIAETGVPKIRFEGQEKEYLMNIRQGRYSYEDILKEAEGLMNVVNEAFDKSSLPWGANVEAIKKWCFNIERQRFLDWKR